MQNLKIAIPVLILCLIMTACFPGTPSPTQTPTLIISTSEECLREAWDAYNSNRFSEAVSFAQECITRWESDAQKQQAALTQAPSIGKVTDAEKEKINSNNWALNDVGTAYFIKAEALDKQGKTNESQDAYKKAMTFPYARCWDPGGFFWSPAEEASKRISR